MNPAKIPQTTLETLELEERDAFLKLRARILEDQALVVLWNRWLEAGELVSFARWREGAK